MIIHRFFYFFSVCCLFIVAAGCSPFAPDRVSSSITPLPRHFSTALAQQSSSPFIDKWWEMFGSSELNALVETALKENLDLQAAWGRLRQARGFSRRQDAGFFPTLGAVGDYDHSRQGTARLDDTSTSTRGETYGAGLRAQYELDLWGRIYSAATAAELAATASAAEVEATAMTVAAEVVSRWIELQEARQQQRILQEQIQANTTYLQLVELRFRNSIATALDVYQQRGNLARSTAQLPQLISQERVLLNELALLLGTTPDAQSLSFASEAPLPELPAFPTLGIPADLLANRPDVRAAGFRLYSSRWDVAAARAGRLPDVTFNGSLVYTGIQLAEVLDTWFLTLAASITADIFDGGAGSGEVEQARGIADEQLATYKKTVYSAFKDVEDALTRETWQKEYITARKQQLEIARLNLRQALQRYGQGLDTYLPVLNALVTVQDLELTQIQDHSQLLQYRIALYTALGGSWPADLQTPADTAQVPGITHTAEKKHLLKTRHVHRQ